jgi:hypothetical protein
MFKKLEGDWAKSTGPGVMQIDLHFGRGKSGQFWNNMANVDDIVIEALKEAQDKGFQYVLFTHGYSTSGPAKTTSRSIVRAIMRSKQSTPLIVKSKSLQHHSVFVAAVKAK